MLPKGAVALTGKQIAGGDVGLTMHGGKSVTRETAVRYRQAGKGEKGLILDELIELTGLHRKYASKVLKTAANACLTEVYGRVAIRKTARKKRAKREYPKYYDKPAQDLLTRAWEGFNHQRGRQRGCRSSWPPLCGPTWIRFALTGCSA
jgi:hypothetical protein